MRTVKRYLLFGGYQYYPSGGWHDFVTSFDDPKEAVAFASTSTSRTMTGTVGYDWWHLVDTETWEQVVTGINDLVLEAQDRAWLPDS